MEINMESNQNFGETGKIKTICPYCPVKDGLLATVKNGKIIKIEGHKEHPVSRGFICEKARHAHETIDHPNRIKALQAATDMLEFIKTLPENLK